MTASLVSVDRIQQAILLLRGQKVILDRDLAVLYGVPTKALKQAVKRNIGRFPEDFMLVLTPEEFAEWRSQFVTSKADRMGLRHPPMAFTEQGVAMLSSVLNSVEGREAKVNVRNNVPEMSSRAPGGSPMSTRVALSPAPSVERRILSIRGQRVMLDADLASLYGVSTRALNQAVKRNRERFPEDFMFRLTEAEKAEVITNCDHLRPLRFSPSLPHAFTEHGAIMLASLLNTRIAVQGSVQVVRAFVRLREILATHKDLARKLEEVEKKYDAQFKVVFDAIRQLMAPPKKARRSIGFRVEEAGPLYRLRRPRRRGRSR